LQRRHWERFAREVGLAPAATVRRVEALATTVAELAPQVAAELSDRFPADREALRLFAERIGGRSAIVAANSRRGGSADLHEGDDGDDDMLKPEDRPQPQNRREG
jgi:hypothetical protein